MRSVSRIWRPACAAGPAVGTAHEQAAVELLIWHETWLRRPDFKGACITQRAAGLVAIINWEEAREFIDRGYTQRGHPGPARVLVAAAPAGFRGRSWREHVRPVQHGCRSPVAHGCGVREGVRLQAGRADTRAWPQPPRLHSGRPGNVRGMRPGGQGRGPHPAGRIMTRQQAGQAPGIVKIRLSGAPGTWRWWPRCSPATTAAAST